MGRGHLGRLGSVAWWKRSKVWGGGSIQSQKDAGWLAGWPRWPPRVLGLSELGQWESWTVTWPQIISLLSKDLEVAQERRWGFSASLAAGVKELCR